MQFSAKIRSKMKKVSRESMKHSSVPSVTQRSNVKMRIMQKPFALAPSVSRVPTKNQQVVNHRRTPCVRLCLTCTKSIAFEWYLVVFSRKQFASLLRHTIIGFYSPPHRRLPKYACEWFLFCIVDRRFRSRALEFHHIIITSTVACVLFTSMYKTSMRWNVPREKKRQLRK